MKKINILFITLFLFVSYAYENYSNSGTKVGFFSGSYTEQSTDFTEIYGSNPVEVDLQGFSLSFDKRINKYISYSPIITYAFGDETVAGTSWDVKVLNLAIYCKVEFPFQINPTDILRPYISFGASDSLVEVEIDNSIRDDRQFDFSYGFGIDASFNKKLFISLQYNVIADYTVGVDNNVELNGLSFLFSYKF